MTMTTQEREQIMREVRRKAQRRAWGKMGFMWHLAVFLMANGAMLAINLNYSPNTLWFVWPLAGWGAALLLHGIATFMGQGMSDDMVDAEIQRELQRRGL